MTSSELHAALLRPAVLQILKATGFSYAKPAVVDTLTDLAARYLLLLASSVSEHAYNNHHDRISTVQDVRLALGDVGALRPQMTTTEESLRGFEEVDGTLAPFEDLRGVRNFINWAQGSTNKEIRRIAGFGEDIDVTEIAAGLDEMEDYLAALKKKHSKTGEESRFQGTLLGKDNDLQPVSIIGGSVTRIADWGVRSRSLATSPRSASPATSGISSVPLTPDNADTPDHN